MTGGRSFLLWGVSACLLLGLLHIIQGLQRQSQNSEYQRHMSSSSPFGSSDPNRWKFGGEPLSNPSPSSSQLLPATKPFKPATLAINGSLIVLSNGFVQATFSKDTGSLTALHGDFLGQGVYGANTLVKAGISLEVVGESGKKKQKKRSLAAAAARRGGAAAVAALLDVQVETQTEEIVKVVIRGIVDDSDQPLIRESWSLSLSRGSRSLRLEASGVVLEDMVGKRAIRSVLMRPTSIYALYEDGIEQMKAAVPNASYYASTDHLPLVYTLGGWGKDDLPLAGNLSLAIERPLSYPGSGMHLLSATATGPAYTRFIEVLNPVSGSSTLPGINTWASPKEVLTAAASEVIAKGTSWKSDMRLYPNNYDFPLSGDVTTGPSLPTEDLAALLTGIYASPLANLRNRVNSVEAGAKMPLLATTIRFPKEAYLAKYNFFDPDNYFTVWAILIAGQPHLSVQAREALETTGRFMQPNGQLPHHFNRTEPVYVAISGETQPGPNVFWVLTCFNYAKLTQDLEWLRRYMPTLRKATAFLFGLIQEESGLAKAPGALFIDVFLRSQLTTDTNAMLVGFFREFADAEEAVGDKAEATRLRALADRISASIERYLWSEEDDDHYVTQLDWRDRSVRDFVDYDANLIALAHGVASSQRARKVFTRVDGGHLTHVAPTYVSERYYGPNDTANGNIGDSACTMGRIAWFDALARRRYGDLTTFDHVLLNPLRNDLRKWTWMHERYGSDGAPGLNRTNYYFEYPSVVAVMLREVRYGIKLGYRSITIDPFGPKQYSYDVGNVAVHYYPASHVSLKLPGSGEMAYDIQGLPPLQAYDLTVTDCASQEAGEGGKQEQGRVVTSDEGGSLRFSALVGVEGRQCTVTVNSRKADEDANSGSNDHNKQEAAMSRG